MSFSANETEKMRILSGGGITFNGDTATANALDDYEEGTWTPTVTQGTISFCSANYTKIGRMVHLAAYVNNWSDRTGSTNIGITGLPFSTADGNQVGSAVFYRVGRTDDGMIGTVMNSSTEIGFLHSSQGGSESWFYLTYSDLNNSNSQIKFSMVYPAT